ncbi:hypothetical protein LIER_43378 [Lithospermum erythrorhizon]|uniref:Uncharacterized protein n=1 Tax=Lithospermum erythrorhizon TaxID=34254 RepID=A0AAV3Q0M6_LITER
MRVNATLISWILNAMTKELAKGFTYATDAFGICEEIRRQFGDCVGPRQNEIRRSIYSAKQGKDSLASSYNNQKTLWEELMCLNLAMKYGDFNPAMKYGDFEEEKTLIFLMGLNKDEKVSVARLCNSVGTDVSNTWTTTDTENKEHKHQQLFTQFSAHGTYVWRVSTQKRLHYKEMLQRGSY